MILHRTPLLITIMEQQPVPTDPKIRLKAATHIGYPPPGMIRKSEYPAGQNYDDSYPCTKEGKKLAKSHAWQYPSKRISVCGKILRY